MVGPTGRREDADDALQRTLTELVESMGDMSVVPRSAVRNEQPIASFLNDEVPYEQPTQKDDAVAEAAVALYIASASLWLTVVRRSFAAFSSPAFGVPDSVDFASANAFSTSALSDCGTLSPASFSIFSMLYTSESS